MKNVLGLSESDCKEIVDTWEVPKFASLCFFKLNLIPHLDGILVVRETSVLDAVAQAACFGCLINSDTLMWRSDGRSEAKEYRQGGITLPVEQLRTPIETLLRAKRDVVILEPLNRFIHRKTFSAVVDSDGRIAVECLGAGYDGSDLQRGFVTPEVILQATAENGRLTAQDFRASSVTSVPMKARVQQRLLNLGQNIIPNYVFDRAPGESHTEYADRFLRAHNFQVLFQERPVAISAGDLRQIATAVEAMFLEFIAKKHWNCLSFNLVRCSERGYVFWDVFEARQKYRL